MSSSYYSLFDILHVRVEIVFAPLDHMAHLFPVVGFIIVSNEAHHSCVVRFMYTHGLAE